MTVPAARTTPGSDHAERPDRHADVGAVRAAAPGRCLAITGLAQPTSVRSRAPTHAAAPPQPSPSRSYLARLGQVEDHAASVRINNLALMAYTTAQAREQLLDSVAQAIEEIGLALASLGEAYE